MHCKHLQLAACTTIIFMCAFIFFRDKLPAAVVEPATPQIVRLVNMDPLSSLSVDKVKQFETEVLNLTKSMSTCRDSSMRAVFLCRRGALLRKVGVQDVGILVCIC